MSNTIFNLVGTILLFCNFLNLTFPRIPPSLPLLPSLSLALALLSPTAKYENFRTGPVSVLRWEACVSFVVSQWFKTDWTHSFRAFHAICFPPCPVCTYSFGCRQWRYTEYSKGELLGLLLGAEAPSLVHSRSFWTLRLERFATLQ